MVKISDWRKEIWVHKHLIFYSLVFLAITLVLYSFAGKYVAKTVGVSAPDLILDNIPTLDLDFIFVYGIVVIVALLFIYPLFFRVKELHKVISHFSLLVMVRSAFITFTHLKIPLNALQFKIPYILSFLDFQNDLFFSGHTALPFLGFLLFKNKIRYLFLVTSIIMAVTVLFMHIHYTIDVLSAYFITYGTFKIGEWFFSKIND